MSGGGGLDPAEVAELVPALARRVAARAPAWLRDEAAGAAAVAMWEAWATDGVASPGGLVTVGRRAAARAVRSATYGCAEGSAFRVAAQVEAPVRLAWPAGEGPARWEAEPLAPARGLGPVLERVVEALVARGMPRAEAEAAVEVVADLAADVGLHAVLNRGTAELAARTGLDPRSVRALVVLLLGQPRARNGGPHPGLVARAARGDDVWGDRRVEALLGQVAAPCRSHLRGAWSLRLHG